MTIIYAILQAHGTHLKNPWQLFIFYTHGNHFIKAHEKLWLSILNL